MNTGVRLSRLELKQLRVFQSLLRERNLSRVADQLGVSQQTISEQLKRLREIFDDRLFVRTSNGVIPTPVAERLAPKLEKLLNDVTALLDVEVFNPAEIDTVFNITATDFEQRIVLPKLLRELRKGAPNLKVIVHKLEIDQLGRQLSTGQIDLAFSTPNFVPDNCPTLLLYKESYSCVASHNSTLVNKTKKRYSPKDIAALEQLVVSPSRGDIRGMADTWFEQQGLKRNVVLSVPSFSAATECIVETDTLAFIPSRLLPDTRLRNVPLTEYPPGFDVIAAWHVRSNQDPLHQWIRNILSEQFQ